MIMSLEEAHNTCVTRNSEEIDKTTKWNPVELD